jgi:hypothetical protein
MSGSIEGDDVIVTDPTWTANKINVGDQYQSPIKMVKYRNSRSGLTISTVYKLPVISYIT